MKTHKGFLLLLVIAALLPILGATSYRFMRREAIKVKLARVSVIPPFTAHFSEHYTAKNGEKKLGMKTTYARRSDGSWMALTQFFVHKGIEDKTREIFLMTGRMARVGDYIRSVTTHQISEAELLKHRVYERDPSTNCTQFYSGETERGQTLTGQYELIHGFNTVQIIYESTSRRLTVWKAPSLGCIILKRLAEFRERGSQGLSNPSELVVDSIQTGEPDSAYFEIPPTYEEVAPSVFYIRDLNIKGVKLSPAEEAVNRDQYPRLDAKYYAQRPK